MEFVAKEDREGLRARLEAEHEERKQRFLQRRAAGQERAQAHRLRKKRTQQLEAESAERLKFYKEKGYRRYVDSRGREAWLLPEEYEWRVKAKKARERRNKKYGGMTQGGKYTHIWLMGAAAILAVVLGLVLIR